MDQGRGPIHEGKARVLDGLIRYECIKPESKRENKSAVWWWEILILKEALESMASSHRYTPEIPEPAPSWSQHGAEFGVLTPKLGPMADNAITQGGIGGLGSLVYFICASSPNFSKKVEIFISLEVFTRVMIANFFKYSKNLWNLHTIKKSDQYNTQLCFDSQTVTYLQVNHHIPRRSIF